jgi:pimeloyl-ACP methyl ester carboxylesterase
LLGFGRSDKPLERTAYSQQALSQLFLQLLDALQIGECIVIGHDWGGAITWNVALQEDPRVIGVGSFCTPFYPYSDTDTLKLIRNDPNSQFNYQLYFQDGEKASEELDRDLYRTFSAIHRVAGDEDVAGLKNLSVNVTTRGGFLVGLPTVVRPGRLFKDPKDLEYYVDGYKGEKFDVLMF